MELETRLHDLARFIHAHIDEDLQLDRLAARLTLSSYYLHRQFKSCFGETPAVYVDRVRLDRAADALLMRDASDIDIAFDHGFEVSKAILLKLTWSS